VLRESENPRESIQIEMLAYFLRFLSCNFDLVFRFNTKRCFVCVAVNIISSNVVDDTISVIIYLSVFFFYFVNIEDHVFL